MSKCTVRVAITASGASPDFLVALEQAIAVPLATLVQLCLTLAEAPLTPSRAFAFEMDLWRGVRELGRAVFQVVLQSGEPSDKQSVLPRLRIGAADEYRARSRTRLIVDTLFGPIEIQRWLYESLTPGWPCLFPFDIRWGVCPGQVSLGLAERIGRLAQDQSQGDVLRALLFDNGIKISVSRLRKAIRHIGEQVKAAAPASLTDRVLQLLRQAEASLGSLPVTIVVGRDGCDIPMRGEGYKVASAATLSVFNRLGRRLGTVYLAQMPQAHQVNLTADLDALIKGTLRAWTGILPRLAYITDSGFQESKYWISLRNSRHPLTKKRLSWQRIADYYHVCQYVNRLGKSLFGEGPQAKRWFRRMRHMLRDEKNGARRIIHSAAAHYARGAGLTGQALNEYRVCLAYLKKRLRYLKYSEYRAAGLAIGSGITEAACKTVFTQRFKRSGMKWSTDGGAAILQIRTLSLSGVWRSTFEQSLALADAELAAIPRHTNAAPSRKTLKNAA